MATTIVEIFRDSETHHRLSLFDLADLMRLPFLLPDEEAIKKVKRQIAATRAARREAHGLLDRAKRAAEVTIEKSEAAGMACLKEVKVS